MWPLCFDHTGQWPCGLVGPQHVLGSGTGRLPSPRALGQAGVCSHGPESWLTWCPALSSYGAQLALQATDLGSPAAGTLGVSLPSVRRDFSRRVC